MRPLNDYPTSWGNVRASIFPHNGPANYTQMGAIAGTIPVTNGDLLQDVEGGLKYFHMVLPGVTDDGCFLVVPVQVVGSFPQPLGPSRTYRLRWMAMVTAVIGGQAQVAGTEATAGTNLSAERVRLLAIGAK
jgi:hypothetical protein